MKTPDVRITDLPADENLGSEELEQVRGGYTEMDLTDSPIAEKYRRDPVSVWVREYVEDVEAY
ncbi:MAG TPA: hypothetical protein VF210_18675 [Pseudomonadales bacterium]